MKLAPQNDTMKCPSIPQICTNMSSCKPTTNNEQQTNRSKRTLNEIKTVIKVSFSSQQLKFWLASRKIGETATR